MGIMAKSGSRILRVGAEEYEVKTHTDFSMYRSRKVTL